MNKVGILTVSFLMAASFSSLSVAQNAGADLGGSQGQDVAQLIDQIDKSYSQMQRTYRTLKVAHDAYIDNPSDDNYKKLQSAAEADATAAENYKTVVAKNETKIKAAEKTYYEETPATKKEIEEAPSVLKGESVEKRMDEGEQQIVEGLTETMESSGNKSAFAKALEDQANKLKSVKERVKNEESKVNPTASQQDTKLENVLGRAIDARMEIVFFANNSQKKACKKYPTNPKCHEGSLNEKEKVAPATGGKKK